MSLPVCHSCGSSELRISRLRNEDLGKLLSLRYPVRCRVCRERTFVFLLYAFGLNKKRSGRKETTVPENGHA
jgi:hypothetical protein